MIYKYIKKHLKNIPIQHACTFFKISRSGYYKHLHHIPSNLEIENEVLTDLIKEVHMKHKGRYDARRIQLHLQQNYQQYVSRRRIGRILHQCRLFSRGTRKKYRKQPSYHIHSNIVNQDFKANCKNQIWFGDITYIPTQEGMIYCSVFIDCFTRKIVGYSIRSHMRETMVIESLEMAIIKEKPKAGLIIHSDNGSQYTGYRFYEVIQHYHFIHSCSRKGNPYDNAMMESFYKSFKREVIPIKQYKSKSQAIVDTLKYLEDYYNKKRMHSSLGCLPPSKFEAST